MKKYLATPIILLLFSQCFSQAKFEMKTITKNGMTVNWQHKNNRIYFEMSAPTDGWVAIGFNDNEDTKGNYLLMGNVINGKASVVEYYTISPGNYKSFAELNIENSISDVQGFETKEGTKLKFSIPNISLKKYSRDLSQGRNYILLIAYSQEDDFQHHSIMRTSTKIIL